VATVWVIVIHTVHWVGGSFYTGLDLVSRFAVPAFVVLTGVLLSYRYGAEALDRGAFLRRRLSRTLIPWLVWAPLFVLYGWFVTGDPGHSVNGICIFLYWGAGHLWFLLLIPQLYLVYLVWPRRNLAVVAAGALAAETALCFAHLYVVPPDGVPASLLGPHAFQLFPLWVGYFGVGVLTGRLLATRGEPRHVSLPAALACVGAVAAAVWLQVQRFPGVASDLQTGTAAFVLPQEPLLVLAVGALVLVTAPPLLARSGVLAWLTATVADNSLGIYILHPPVVYVIGKRIFPILLQPFPQSLPGFLLLTIGGLIGATLLARLISATPLAPTLGTPMRPIRLPALLRGTERAET
jgi:surface polysaccharide O-acyltransferase-like enzyme